MSSPPPSPTQQSIALLASAARTATPTVGPGNSYEYLTNHQRFRGAAIIVDATAVTSSPSVVVTIDGYDYGSDTWYNILTGAAITSVSTNVYRVHPDLTAVTNLTAKDGLPYLWKVVLTHGDADSITYSVGVNNLD